MRPIRPPGIRCAKDAQLDLLTALTAAAGGTSDSDSAGNNNVDTCARVCHAPTGYGLSQTFGTSAGTQDFKSVQQADLILLIGANPTDGHPVFGSRMKN